MKNIFVFLGLFILQVTNLFAQNIQYNYDNIGRLTQITYPNQKSIVYSYDKDGNRSQSFLTASTVCNGSTAAFYSGSSIVGDTYQWQVDVGSGFTNITNGFIYSGTNSSFLTLNNPPTFWYGYKYRCVINGGDGQSFSKTETLKFSATWLGGVSIAWENPANWGCGSVPDAYTDVIVNGGPYLPKVSFTTSCRSLTLGTNATCTVAVGQVLYITGK